MKRTASAVWQGALKDGRGSISTRSGASKDTPYSFTSRFENGSVTNAECPISRALKATVTMTLKRQ